MAPNSSRLLDHTSSTSALPVDMRFEELKDKVENVVFEILNNIHGFKAQTWETIEAERKVFNGGLAKLQSKIYQITSKSQVESLQNEDNWEKLAKELKDIQTEQATLVINVKDLQEKIDFGIHTFNNQINRKIRDNYLKLCGDVAMAIIESEQYQASELMKFEQLQEQFQLKLELYVGQEIVKYKRREHCFFLLWIITMLVVFVASGITDQLMG